MDMFADPTARAVLIAKANKFGNKGLQRMQGSSIVKYHFLPMDGRTTFRFFENVNTTRFPFTNLTENKLQVGEGMVLERGYFAIMSVTDPDAALPTVADVNTLRAFGFGGLYISNLNFNIANNQVLKPIPLTSFESNFNRHANFQNNDVFRFDTDTTLQPLIEFVGELRTPTYAVADPPPTLFLGLFIEGRGAILNPRTNF